MKFTTRFTVRAALVLAAAGTIGAFGACKKDDGVGPTPPPPPPPLPAPTALTATPMSTTRIDLAWTDNATTETGYKVERCSGAGCTNFAQIGTNLAADTKVYVDSTGLVASTQYTYRVAAFNATDTSAFATVSATTLAVQAAPSFTMIGAGEITTCSSVGTAQTATLIQNQITADPGTIVFTIGNNVAGTTGGNYATCFDPSWGRFKSNMRAAVGQGDYEAVGQDAMYAYFGDKVGAPNGWYSFDVGDSWHVVVLNTSTWQWGVNNLTGDDPSKPKPMLDWLAADLAANTKPCLMAISWERRLYTSGSGTMGRNQNMNHIAQMLYAAGADILVSAKDKQYMRFPKTNVDGVPDAAGFAQFVVGTGGRSLDAMHAPAAGNPVAAQFGGQGNAVPDSWGVIKFTLNSSSYKWEFLSTQAGGFTDSGEQACN